MSKRKTLFFLQYAFLYLEKAHISKEEEKTFRTEDTFGTFPGLPFPPPVFPDASFKSQLPRLDSSRAWTPVGRQIQTLWAEVGQC